MQLRKHCKGNRRQMSGTFLCKKWYNIKVCSMFPILRSARRTFCELWVLTSPQRCSRDTVLGSLCRASESQQNEHHRKYLRCEGLVNFKGIDFARAKLRNTLCKCENPNDVNFDVSTTYGYRIELHQELQ